ncbi:MAG: hypothetical protein IJV17_02570 [Prevotella sp.]|nr:hypothetical protein [Prevotella sp.]
MYKMTIGLIQRAAVFSPNNVENDRAILECVSRELKGEDYRILQMSEEELEIAFEADVYVSMGRDEHTLLFLADQKAKRKLVVNTPEGVDLCNHRASQMQLLEYHGFPVAPLEGTEGYWVKRGDGPSELKEDVAFAATKAEAVTLQEKMSLRGISAFDVRAHVTGDLVKFYGVCGTTFFRYYYPSADGHTKFGHETRNGHPAHYSFDEDMFRETVTHAAALLQIEVYGGDAVVRPDGSFVLIDVNDWPSFSRCRDEAAQAIVERLDQLMKH